MLPRRANGPTPLTTLAYLLERFPGDAQRIVEKVVAGEVITGSGAVVDAETPYEAGGFVYLYRDPPVDEPEVAELADLRVLFRDENLLVVDKPHYVSVLPRGRWVQNTALVHLRRELDLPELSPVHRLDRLTAGVLVFTVRTEVRGAYQVLFEKRQVRKDYLAVAPLATRSPSLRRSSGDEVAASRPRSQVADLSFPLTVRSRIVKVPGTVAALPEAGPPNAESLIDLAARDDARGLGLYRLVPHTGKTHQLRLHMASLGLPICHDPFAPFWLSGGAGSVPPWCEDATQPLQLLAHSLAFVDPFTGQQVRFVSQRSLSEWPRLGDLAR